MTAKIQVNYITNLVFGEVITNKLGMDVYFNTIMDYPKKNDGKQIFSTGLGGCSSGPVVKDMIVVPDTFRISGFWTKEAFDYLLKALRESGAEVYTAQETI